MTQNTPDFLGVVSSGRLSPSFVVAAVHRLVARHSTAGAPAAPAVPPRPLPAARAPAARRRAVVAAGLEVARPTAVVAVRLRIVPPVTRTTTVKVRDHRCFNDTVNNLKLLSRALTCFCLFDQQCACLGDLGHFFFLLAPAQKNSVTLGAFRLRCPRSLFMQYLNY